VQRILSKVDSRNYNTPKKTLKIWTVKHSETSSDVKPNKTIPSKTLHNPIKISNQFFFNFKIKYKKITQEKEE
jgi:hypothetical protein